MLAPCVYDVAWENVESSSSRQFSHVIGTFSQIGAMLAYAGLTIVISFGASQESWSIIWPGFTDRLKDWKWMDVDFGKLGLDTLSKPTCLCCSKVDCLTLLYDDQLDLCPPHSQP